MNKVSSFHPITSCFLDDHSSIYTFTTPWAATLLVLHRLLGNWVPAHLHLTCTPCNLTALRLRVHVFYPPPWHTGRWILQGEGSENMQRRGEATQDSTILKCSATWWHWHMKWLLPLPSSGSSQGVAARSLLTVKPDFLYEWQLTDIINRIRRRLWCLPLMLTPWG